MEEIHILLFYKYAEIENPERFKKKHLKFCKNLEILGRILVSTEGINGSVSGTKGQVEEYKKELSGNSNFSDIVFKEDIGKSHPFKKMQILVKNEIVGLREDPSLENTGKYLKPKEFLEIYDSKTGKLKENVILIDTRNDYEYKVGHFKDAIELGIKTFRQFPEAIKKFGNKDKKVVVYCTGGIRCEKASALMKENGFKDVSQLEGGIITLGKDCEKESEEVWEGGLFVFDKRLITSLNKKDVNPITGCEVCGIPCDLCKNCRSVVCDRLIIECLDCQKKLNGCCSDKCFSNFRVQCREKAFRNQGRKTVSKVSA